MSGLTDGSGTLTAAGTSQQVFAQNTGRQYLLLQNVSTGDLWVNFGTPAVESQPSIKLVAGASMEFYAGFVPSGAVHIRGAAAGQAFVAKQG